MNLPIYPHLGMTEDQLAEICEELFLADPVIAKWLQSQVDYRAKIENYHERERNFELDIDKLVEQIERLTGEIRALDEQKRVIRGAIANMVYSRKMADCRIREADKSIEKRKRQLYLSEARRRLAALGKEMKLGIGTGSSRGTIIRDVPPKRKFVSKPYVGKNDPPGFEIPDVPAHENQNPPEQDLLRPHLDGHGPEGNQPPHEEQGGGRIAGEAGPNG